MRSLAAALLLVLVVAAAPAAASERSEARRYTAAMQPRIAVAPAELDAIVADYQARSGRVANGCMTLLQEAASDSERRFSIALVYGLHAYDAFYRRQLAWIGAADERLAAIRTSTRALRRGRAARAHGAAVLARALDAASGDFCALLEAWRAAGWRGDPAWDAVKPIFARSRTKPVRRATAVLRRHGATRAQRRAFNGEARWPEFDFPGPDPVAQALDATIEPEH